MSKVGIVIPFYKNGDQLKRCKDAISKQTTKIELGDVIVIDNSIDNTGFTKAVNKGVSKLIDSGNYDYAIVLNQDCYLRESAIENMVKFMDEHENCFIGGIKQIDYNNDDRIIHGGCTLAFPNGLHMGGSVKDGHCNESMKVSWVNGACFIVRLDDVKRVGLMDENYFLICSDSDWCYTARARGFDIYYIAEAECTHEIGISQKQNRIEFNNRMMADTLYFRDKWIGNGLYRELSIEVFGG